MDQKANDDHDGSMNLMLLVLAIMAFLVISAHLTRLVVHDGLGSNPPPRSHRAEMGSWIDRELQR